MVGRYYDENGDATQYLKDSWTELSKAQERKAAAAKLEEKFPSCNVKTVMADPYSDIWCSPEKTVREMRVMSEKMPDVVESRRCVCIDPTSDEARQHLKLTGAKGQGGDKVTSKERMEGKGNRVFALYPNCDPDANRCRKLRNPKPASEEPEPS